MGVIFKVKRWELLEISNYYLFALSLRILLKLICPRPLNRKGGGSTPPFTISLKKRGRDKDKIVNPPITIPAPEGGPHLHLAQDPRDPGWYWLPCCHVAMLIDN